MTTIQVSEAQAAHLASMYQKAIAAQKAAENVLMVLTMGRLSYNATLVDINTDTGVLTFAPPEAPDAPEHPHG